MSKKDPKVRTPRSYRPEGCDYEAAPTAMVIGGKLVEFIAHPQSDMCCRAVFPVNESTVLKVQIVDLDGDWASNQNALECDAWYMVKDTHRAKRFTRTWGYDEKDVTFMEKGWDGREWENTVVISWCFQERLHGESLDFADDETKEKYKRLGQWLENKFDLHLGDWRTRQARFVKGHDGHWKVHDYAEIASDEACATSSGSW